MAREIVHKIAKYKLNAVVCGIDWRKQFQMHWTWEKVTCKRCLRMKEKKS